MVTQELLVEIKVMHRQGKSIRQIADELGVSRNTVRKYLREPESYPTYSPRPPKPSVLDPYRSYIEERICAAHPNWIPAVVLFEEIKRRGYPGGYSTVKQFVASKKPKSAVEPDNRFETAPGQQLQVDFTTLRRGRDPVKALVATLGFSRSTYVRFSRHERQEDWLMGIELALDHFGGVPQELLFDNAKCIMLERDAYGRGSHRWNPDLLLMAKHYGFIPRACRPYRARTKGKVERFNRYLKQSFATPLMATLSQAGLAFDADVANAYVGPWLTETAEQRLHGTTKQRPSSLLEEERMALLPLPPTGWQLKIDPPSVSTLKTAAPIESLQHPLSVYDALLDAVL